MVLLANKLTNTSWPLQHARWGLVAVAVVAYFASFVFRALGWQQLFVHDETRPGRARCLASVGAAAASGVVLPFRLDYMVKIGLFRRLGGKKCLLGLEAIGLSIVALGLVDAVAMLPLSISATATTGSSFRIPLIVVVAFGFGAAGLLFSGRLLAHPRLRDRRLSSWISRKILSRIALNRATALAALFLLGCWSTRAIGMAVLLAAMGAGFSFPLALILLCLGAAAAVLPLTSGGLVANVGATAGVLLALGVGRDQAINFSLASGMLLTGAALAASVCGLLLTSAMLMRTRFRARSHPLSV